MRLHYMVYFIRAVDRGSVSAAAADLFITPQGLSQALQRIEREYCAQLLYREGSNIRPTKAGEAAYETFSQIISLNNDLKDQLEINKYASASEGTDSLTVFPSAILTTTLLPDLIPLYCKQHPQVRLRIIELPSRESHDVTERPENMICLFGTTPSMVDAFSRRFPELDERRPIYRTNMLACVSERSPLAAKSVLTSEDFIDRDIVLCRNEEYFLRAICPEYDLSRVLIRSKSKFLTFSVITENKNSIGFTNSFEARYYDKNNTVTIPLAPPQEVVYGYLMSRAGLQNPTLTDFANMVEGCFRKII